MKGLSGTDGEPVAIGLRVERDYMSEWVEGGWGYLGSTVDKKGEPRIIVRHIDGTIKRIKESEIIRLNVI